VQFNNGALERGSMMRRANGLRQPYLHYLLHSDHPDHWSAMPVKRPAVHRPALATDRLLRDTDQYLSISHENSEIDKASDSRLNGSNSFGAFCPWAERAREQGAHKNAWSAGGSAILMKSRYWRSIGLHIGGSCAGSGQRRRDLRPITRRLVSSQSKPGLIFQDRLIVHGCSLRPEAKRFTSGWPGRLPGGPMAPAKKR